MEPYLTFWVYLDLCSNPSLILDADLATAANRDSSYWRELTEFTFRRTLSYALGAHTDGECTGRDVAGGAGAANGSGGDRSPVAAAVRHAEQRATSRRDHGVQGRIDRCVRSSDRRDRAQESVATGARDTTERG